jgi:HEAT repeat protein
MVRKIDPQTDALLVEEMQSSSRSRRLRGVSAAATLDAVPTVGETVVELLRDEDHLVRLEAARALAQYPTESTRDALRAALGDRSALVQEAIRHTLEHVETALERSSGGGDESHA